MTTARAFLRSGSRHYKNPEDFINQANRYLTYDAGSSGRFVAMFFLEIDTALRTLRWVRAGHDPAIVFDPINKRSIDLSGEGIALGVDETYQYSSYGRFDWEPGTIIAIGTDGIREARGKNGDFYGKARLLSTIADHSDLAASKIQEKVFDSLETFLNGAQLEDDITLVVAKLPG
jgi:sigma-B regulation protein RsbU (phosphoserine phosphatase)